MKWTPRRLQWILNLYPPYLGAGIRVTHIDPQWSEIRVSMKLRWRNRNAVGTHFGGSLYSMVDPHLMLMFMQRLGSDYVVWDKSSGIEFKKPGRGTVHSVIRVSEADLEEIRHRTAAGGSHCPTYEVAILDEQGGVVAHVTKTLYVRLRDRSGVPAPAAG